MTLDRIKLCVVAAALAASLTGEAYAQSPGASGASPAPAGTPALSPGGSAGQPSVAAPAPGGARPPSSRALAEDAQTQGNATTSGTAGSVVTGGGISGGMPAMNGITPNRAELAGSAFTKLDGGNRGYITLDDVRQLDGFESAFRQADQNGDGRLNPSEFNSAWGTYTGNVR